MSSLIDDLLAFASTGMREPPKRVELQSVMEQALENLTLEIKESGARVTMDQLPAVAANEINLVRLFQNLMGNAMKYRGKDSPEIHVACERKGKECVIRIEDNGVGIAPEDQARVFTPFVRLADRKIPGTGLGLAVCKNIVEGLGGRIWVESELGVGSTFYCTLLLQGMAGSENPT
jgi:chemotaxis family two-component system sensor kinase Cph1